MSSEDTSQVPWKPFLVAVGSLAVVGLAGLAATAYVALRTSRGMRLDLAASEAVSSPVPLLDRLYQGLGLLSVGSVAVSLMVCVMLAVVRRRFDLALGAVVLIGGADLTTQFLKKDLFTRVGSAAGLNSLPSGHTTVALSIALAAVIVAPPAWRSAVAIGGAATAALVGVSLVLGRWHHVSDVLAATFVCVLWAAAGMLTAALVRQFPPVPARDVPLHLGALIGASTVGVVLVSWGVRPAPGLRDLGLGILSLGSVGLACAVSVAAVAHLADRHLE